VTLAQSQVTNLTTDLAAKAPLASPALTGNPTAPTATTGDNDTSIATTAFVNAEIAADVPALATAAVTTHVGLADPHTQYQKESEKGAASGYASLDASTLVPAAQLPAATPTTKGAVVLATNGEATAGEVVEATDSRLTNARAPTSHAIESHTASDIATLNATTSLHGLLPKLGGGTTNFLRADGTWAAPPSGGPDHAGTGQRMLTAEADGTHQPVATVTYDDDEDDLTIDGTPVRSSLASALSYAWGFA